MGFWVSGFLGFWVYWFLGFLAPACRELASWSSDYEYYFTKRIHAYRRVFPSAVSWEHGFSDSEDLHGFA